MPLLVYPRAYGETRILLKIFHLRVGLSPRLRGNPKVAAVVVAHQGSIPALTGKPNILRILLKIFQVYPRAYGETPMI